MTKERWWHSTVDHALHRLRWRPKPVNRVLASAAHCGQLMQEDLVARKRSSCCCTAEATYGLRTSTPCGSKTGRWRKRPPPREPDLDSKLQPSEVEHTAVKVLSIYSNKLMLPSHSRASSNNLSVIQRKVCILAFTRLEASS